MDNLNKKLIFAFREDKLGMTEVIFCWQPGCKWLAFCGDTRVIVIVDRLGKKINEFQLKFGGKVKHMEFDNEGDTLAIIQEQCSIVTVISVYTKKTLDIDIDKNNKDKPTCIRWGKNHPTLAIGTERGLIYYYNKKSDKIYPVSMNHAKSVISADWNDEGNLATGDENKSLSVTNRMGEPILQNAVLKADPKMIKWARQKRSDSKNAFTTISTVLSNKTILIYDIKKKSNPIELALDSDYGNIVTYQWFGDGYIAIGFSKGYISIISTHMTEIKNEVHSWQPFKSGLDDLSICEEMSRIAIAGENSVKIFDTNTWTEIVDEKIEISNQAGRISKIQWSNSGEILIISTYLGSIFAFNVIVNDAFAISKNLFACLWSLNEVSTFDIQSNKPEKLYQLQLVEGPKSFALSSDYLVANYGTKYQIFYTSSKNDKNENNENNNNSQLKEFTSNITLMSVNKEYLAILSEGRVNFIKIETDSTEKIFPLKDTDDQILFVVLTEHFLIYSDSNNKVKVYMINYNCTNISDYKFDNPIKKIFPNQTGTKFICIDNLGKGFLYNPVNETSITLENVSEVMNVIWDETEENIFAVISKSNIVNTYMFIESSLEGPKVNILKDFAYLEDLESNRVTQYNQQLDSQFYPFNLQNGYLNYYVKNTKEIKGVYLLSHYWIYNWRDQGENEDGHKKYFMQNYQLGKYWDCLRVVNYLTEEKKEYLEKLGKEALKNLNIDVAEEAFRKANNTSLVLTIEKLRTDHDKNILLGHIAAILGEENLAQDLFKNSSNPKLALDLRMDLQDWNIALKLANEIQPYRENFISRKLAYQLETQLNISEAIKMYEKSLIINIHEYLNSIDDSDIDQEEINHHNLQCYAGIVRCSFRLGDTNRGLQLAQDLTDKNLIIEAAHLCESLNYFLEAATLYQQVGLFEKAATVYITLKHFKSAEALIDKIKSPKLLIQLAKMKEAEKLYNDAEKAYENAGDWESVIRINLKFLDNPLKARDILMNKSKTENCALMLSDYYDSKGKKKETIEYKLIAKRYEEAFAIAQSCNEMDSYADYMIKNNKIIDEFKKIAIYYEGKNMFGKSGIFYEKCGEFPKALKMYMKGMNEEYLDKAVEMVGNTKDDSLVNDLIEFLLNSQLESGPHFLTRLYVLLGKYKEACEIATSLANQEQELSNYKNAHHIILDLYRELKDRNLPVSFDLNHRLSVLHSYTLAKKMIINKQHLKATRNLLKVANNISMFEKDIVKILTTVVIECAECGLNKSASQFSIELMKENYKNLIPESYRGKIEKISRNAYKNEEEAQQTLTHCPFCNIEVPDYNLQCQNCQNVIPFCIASGRHVIQSELTKCYKCNFPAIISEFTNYLNSSNDKLCPMCDEPVDHQLLEKIEDPLVYLKSRKVANLESVEKREKENSNNYSN